MNASTVALLTSAFALVAIAGGLSAWFGKSRGDSIIAYTTQLHALTKEDLARSKEENAGLAKENAGLIKERDRLIEENAYLQTLAQGSPQLVALTGEIKSLVQHITTKPNET